MAQRRTRNGRVVTDDMLLALAAEAEAGYPPVEGRLPRLGRPLIGEGLNRVVQFRVEDATFEQLIAVSREQGKGVSEVAREALEGYLRAHSSAEDQAKTSMTADMQALAKFAYMVHFGKVGQEQPSKALADAPLSTITGLSPADAEALQKAFNIKTIRQLAESKFVLSGQDIFDLVQDSEHHSPTSHNPVRR